MSLLQNRWSKILSAKRTYRLTGMLLHTQENAGQHGLYSRYHKPDRRIFAQEAARLILEKIRAYRTPPSRFSK